MDWNLQDNTMGFNLSDMMSQADRDENGFIKNVDVGEAACKPSDDNNAEMDRRTSEDKKHVTDGQQMVEEEENSGESVHTASGSSLEWTELMGENIQLKVRYCPLSSLIHSMKLRLTT